MPYKNKEERKDRQRAYYKENKEKIASQCRKKRIKLRDITFNIKKQSKCAHCGYDDYRALVFHHTDPNNKNDDISRLISCGVLKNLMDELEKCTILCANCHSILHFEKTVIK